MADPWAPELISPRYRAGGCRCGDTYIHGSFHEQAILENDDETIPRERKCAETPDPLNLLSRGYHSPEVRILSDMRMKKTLRRFLRGVPFLKILNIVGEKYIYIFFLEKLSFLRSRIPSSLPSYTGRLRLEF